MAFFRNDTVNLLNLHYAIHSLALSGGGAFFAAFLLHAGVPAPMVLASLALILAGRFVIRPLVLAPARRFGLKPLVIAGTVLTGLQYPLLAEVHGVGWPLLALCAVSSVGDTVYWTSYHAYFASLGDAGHRGHQIGAREALAALIGIVGPLATGWALTRFGPHVAFWATAAVLLLAAIPIFYARNVPVPQYAPGAFKAAFAGMLMFVSDGWIAASYVFVWQIALFISLGQDFTIFGGAMALAAVVGAASGLFLGRFIDAGHGRRAVWLAAGVIAVVVCLRAASYGNPAMAVAANALGALVPTLYQPTLMTAVYNLAQKSPCALRFHIATEGGWDAGASSGCLIAAGLLWAGAPFSVGVLLALIGAASVAVLLMRYYERQALTPA
ncbi:MFS transporter [Phenylobacterium montanum]|uniref:MFS transporter n=1 Tax=Phenylobacterium montanum TaxID=2823693 RepID=A0A975G1W2_9CAUL|nr:MFS transporter [Caulobacter sp. S6]QUD89033.1 MFS transporter [Caulobacter sp. S6]